MRWNVLLALACSLVLCVMAQGDIIFMKDGFSIQGKVQKTMDQIVDPGGTIVAINRVGATFAIDDGVRRITFPPRLVSEAQQDQDDKAGGLIRFNLLWKNMGVLPQSPQLGQHWYVNTGPFDSRGMRRVEVRANREKNLFGVDEVVKIISSDEIELWTKVYRHKSKYLPSEFPARDVVTWMRNHLKDQKKEGADEQFAIVRYCIYQGWFKEADDELNRLKKELPNETEKQAQLWSILQQAKTQDRLEEIEIAITAGQHERVLELLRVPDDEFSQAPVLAKLAKYRDQYKTKGAGLERLRQLYSQCFSQAEPSPFLSECKIYLEEIYKGINLDTMERLSVFQRLAEQEARLKERNQPAAQSKEQLLSYVITGWLLGQNGAEGSSEAARKWVAARQFLFNYLKDDSELSRGRLLELYQKNNPLSVLEMKLLLEGLDPIAAVPLPGKNPLKLSTPPTELWPEGIKYHMYLPPEYHHHKAWPVLVVAPNRGFTLTDTAKPWLNETAKRGMILVVIEWNPPEDLVANGSDKEREAVYLVMREMRKVAHVDATRIGIAGFAAGGSLALDVALTRPDLFCGCIVTSALLPLEAESLKTNAQYLPFYVVDGDMNYYREKVGVQKKDALQKLFDFWIPNGYPSMLVDYRGRGFDRFEGEIPRAVDWLSRKKRAKAWPVLGKPSMTEIRNGQELKTVRANIKRLYWLSGDGGNPNEKKPVTLTANWENTPNSMRAEVFGWKNVRVWLNDSMVSFNNPVELKVHFARLAPPTVFKGVLTPSLKVLLEDFYERGDASEPYVTYVDLK